MMRLKINTLNNVCILIIIIQLNWLEILMKPQLDLPPIINNGKLDVFPNSYTLNKDSAGDGGDDAQKINDEYDRDRSYRYGPPYSNTNSNIINNSNNNNRIYGNQSSSNYDQTFNPPIIRNGYGYNDNLNEQRYGDQPYNNNNNNNNGNINDDRLRFEDEKRIRLENERLQQFLIDIDHKSSLECTLNVQAQWNFETNVHEITQLEALTAQQRYSDFQRTIWNQLKNIDQSNIYDQHLYRQVKMLSIIGPNALPPDQLDRYNRLINDMLAIYNKASICGFEQPFNCGLRLEPDLKEIMAKSRDWDELQYTWIEWRRKSGRDMKDLFEQMIDLTNQAAVYNNLSNAAEYWTYPYESLNFRDDMENVWQEILPLYELIHAYVRRKLREFYGPDRIQNSAPLPDHIFGNMYGQNWLNILDIIIPYPGRSFLDVTPQMLQQGYTPNIMFQLAEEFFLSINMTALPRDFWIDSIFEQPIDRNILCQPSAWDFCNKRDYRIKMCTQVTHKHLLTVHQEMAHIQYFVHYREQPKIYRDGANTAFHEAVGDVIALSIATPKHLQTLGLVQKSVDDVPHDINFLFALAIEKVVFLPYALALDVWRWDIFNKKINKEQYNCYWWLLRERYGGIKPPVLRSELDFDPGSKYHVPANIPYIRYFFGTILQFQLHRAVCTASQQYDPTNADKPLHKCDIYRQPIAGNILKEIMKKGSSKPWQDVLQETIGESRLDGSALREYFRPLEEWLRNENLRNQEYVGWSYDGDYCKHSIETANLQVFGGFYNKGNSFMKSSIICIVTLNVIPLIIATILYYI